MYEFKNGCDKILENPIVFEYKNWKGALSTRKIIPIKIWYGESDYHASAQWFIRALDIEKQENRDFAIQNIIKYIKMEEV